MYARAADNVRPPPDVMMYRVPVEVAPGQFRDLLSTQVHSFRSAAQAAATAGRGGVEASDVQPEAVSAEASSMNVAEQDTVRRRPQAWGWSAQSACIPFDCAAWLWLRMALMLAAIHAHVH